MSDKNNLLIYYLFSDVFRLVNPFGLVIINYINQKDG